VAIWIFLLGVIACSCSSQGNWKHSQINGAEPHFSSHRLSYLPSNTFHPLKLEIIRNSKSCKGYLVIEQKPIPPVGEDLQKAIVHVTIDNNAQSYVVSRYQEGYRLLLSQELLQTLIQSLSEGKSITLEVANHSTVLSPEGFLSRYKEFQKDFHISKFVHSPF